MTSPPPSIASFIAGQGDSGLGAGSDEDQAALLTYLRTEYPGSPGAMEQSTFAGDLAALPSSAYRFAPAGNGSEIEQSTPEQAGPSTLTYAPPPTTPHSPPNPTISIPPSLAELAAQSTVTLNLPDLAPSDYSNINFSKSDDTGEMGGKRRKQPHERAGWKEMDQEPRTKRKRGGRRGEGNGNGNGEESMGDMGYLTAQVNTKDEQVHLGMGGGGNDASYPGGEGAGNHSTVPSGSNQDISDPNDPNASPKPPVARAAQNRKAQQVYRRKREDKMKDLEAQAAMIPGLKYNLSVAESKLRELALSIETEHIEKLALRQALRNLSQLGTGILDSSSALITQIGVRPREGVEETTAEVDQAFKLLEAQSRELAKANWKRAS